MNSGSRLDTTPKRHVGRCCLLALIVAGGVSICSAAEDYYHNYLSLLGTNDVWRKVRIDFSPLIDTNNTAPKLAASVINLREAMTNCQIGDIRIGMTMEQVVAHWGKPERFWPRCYGGPLFTYRDISVIFEPGSNSVLFVHCNAARMPRFAEGLSATLDIPEFIRVLGSPTARRGPEKNSWPSSELVYVVTDSTLRLGFANGHLVTFWLQRPGVEFSNGKLVPLRLDRADGSDPRQ
jgi:hypothetical protein